MTIRDLKNEVEALGFFAAQELDDSLVATANRAIRMIHTVHPKKKRGEIVFLPKDAIVRYEPVAGGGSEISLSVPAGRLMMKIRGEGEYVVRIGNVQKTYRFFSDTNNLKVDFSRAGELIFSADSVFCAWDIASFRSDMLPYEDAVSFTGDTISFELKKIFPDMLYLIDIPTNTDGREIRGLSLPNVAQITVPADYRGVISILYSAKASEITIDSEDEKEIDIADELTPLLPLLISYFLFMDESPDMARMYLAEYEKLSGAIRRCEVPGAVKYTDVNRWS